MKQPPKNRTRNFAIRAAGENSPEHGGLTGIACRVGELDSYSTVFHPRSATPEMIARFAEQGKFLGGHNAWNLAIGYVESARLNGRDIEVDLAFLPDTRSQEYRVNCEALVAAGREVGLSIGFNVSNYEWFKDGKAMIAAAAARGDDLSLLNVEQISAYDDDCWFMYVSEIAEVSMVNFQSVKPSVVTGIRSVDDTDPEIECINGMPVTESVDTHAEARETIARIQETRRRRRLTVSEISELASAERSFSQ